MTETNNPIGAAVDVLAVLALVNAASPGPWETDTVKCDGGYGSGEDSHSGFMAEQMRDANGVAIFDSLNSEGVMVDEDIGEESVYAWDVVANRNFEAVAAAVNFIRDHGTAVAALLARDAELEAENKALREVTDEMVERALTAWFHDDPWVAVQAEFDDGGERFRSDMRAALNAALARTPAATTKGNDND